MCRKKASIENAACCYPYKHASPMNFFFPFYFGGRKNIAVISRSVREVRCWKDFVIGSGRSFFPGFKDTEWEMQAYGIGRSVGKPARCWQHGCDRDLPDPSHSAGLPREPRLQPSPSWGWAWTGRGSALPCPTSTHPALSLVCEAQ